MTRTLGLAATCDRAGALVWGGGRRDRCCVLSVVATFTEPLCLIGASVAVRVLCGVLIGMLCMNGAERVTGGIICQRECARMGSPVETAHISQHLSPCQPNRYANIRYPYLSCYQYGNCRPNNRLALR